MNGCSIGSGAVPTRQVVTGRPRDCGFNCSLYRRSVAGGRERWTRRGPHGGLPARIERSHREPNGTKGKLADTIARVARTSRHVEAAHDRNVDIALLSALRVSSRHRQSRRGRDRQVGVDASGPAIRATSTSARLVRRANRGTGGAWPIRIRARCRPFTPVICPSARLLLPKRG